MYVEGVLCVCECVCVTECVYACVCVPVLTLARIRVSARVCTHSSPVRTYVGQEPMVVLVQMQHDNYLNKLCFAAATSAFPRPTDLPINLRRGDFDLLFLHRQHGLVVAEIKSVGWRPGNEI